jgi:catechol 2,3-dioxygenase-like lactoylglutathione lyase family enzyme
MLGSTNIVAFVPTTDAARARAFYEGVLGLRFVKDDGFAMVLDANGIMVRAAKVGADWKPLQGKGVHFEIFGFFKQDELGIWTAPTGDKVAWFKDPDGNVLSVSQHV